MWSDYVTYQWQNKVVGYDVESQKRWFDRLGFNGTYTAILVLIFGILIVICVYLSWIYYLNFKRRDRVKWALNQLSKQLPEHLQKKLYESVVGWLNYVVTELNMNIDDQNLVKEIIEKHQKYMYGFSKDEKDIQVLLKLINRCSNVFVQYKKSLS